jgi:hypothetical protein
MPITPYILDQLYTPIIRLRVTPDEPVEPAPPITVQRAPGHGRPHTGPTVARVRYLFENTGLTYAEIAAQTGVSRGVITQWKCRHRWRRPEYAPRAPDRVPDWRAGRSLKLRKLALRLRAQAERCVRDLEAEPKTDVDTLMRALQVLKVVRLEAMGHCGRGGLRVGPAVTGAESDARNQVVRAALTEMRANATAQAAAQPCPKD